jgi:hypothetical protein
MEDQKDALRMNRADLADRLENIQTIMPEQERIICEYAEYVASTLNREGQIVPGGVLILFGKVMYDIMNGTRADGAPLPAGMQNLHKMMITVFDMASVEIVRAVCTEPFAEKYVAMWNEAHRKH